MNIILHALSIETTKQDFLILIYLVSLLFIFQAAAYITEICPPQIRGVVISAKEIVISNSSAKTFCRSSNSTMFPVLGPALASNADIHASVSAMCLFDDCVEHCGQEAAAKYSTKLLLGVLMAFEDPSDKDFAQTAVYGVAQIARYAKQFDVWTYSDHCPSESGSYYPFQGRGWGRCLSSGNGVCVGISDPVWAIFLLQNLSALNQ